MKDACRAAELTHSQNANIICGMIKGQDILMLAVLMGEEASELPYSELGRVACLSVSEAYASVKRLQESALINSMHRPVKRNVEEFLFHGIRYAFPMRPSGESAKGMPTAYAAPVARDVFAAVGQVPVWSGSEGDIFGKAYAPIYPSAPKAASNDCFLYDRLALIDMLRGGRLRERNFSEKKLKEMLA